MSGSDGKPVGIGVVGCGVISDIYLKNLSGFSDVAVLACADLDPARAAAKAKAYGVPKACSVAELLADPAIEIVLNLTIPNAHAEVAFAAMEAGKSVYNEKPLAIALEDGRRLVALAGERGVRIGGAPDTFLGAGLQTCRALIDSGAIGEPVAGVASMLCHGHEGWHPQPDFYYQLGGGPMFDMGPYYLTTLVSLLGPIRRVTGSTRISFPERVINSQPRAGEHIAVDVPTHIAAVLDFANGAVVSLATSFDAWASEQRVELYGSSGTLAVPDPNTFGGPISIRQSALTGWESMPVERPYAENSRGLGVLDMAQAIREDRPHRASGELTLHVLEIMHAIHRASDEGRHIEIESTVDRPEPLPA
jgi:predicted dehydrogenase